MAKVMIILGSQSDQDKAAPCMETLRMLEAPFTAAVCSAHRTPDKLEEMVKAAEKAGVEVFICMAGLAAHLAGAVAARTTRPVIGVPLTGSSLGGMDALLSTVQMPSGYPVATMALDKAGATNAAWLAAEMLALADSGLAGRISAARKRASDAVAQSAMLTEAELEALD